MSGFIEPTGVIVISSLEITSGDLWLELQFESNSPNRAPVAQAVVTPNVCGEPTHFDASASYDPDGEALAYTWTWDGAVIGTDSTLDYTFPDGAWTVVLEVSDPTGLRASLPLSFVATADHVAPEFVTLPSPVSTTDCDGVDIGTPAVWDACGVTSLTNDAPPVFPLGQTVVTWTAIDTAGHIATATQVVAAALGDDPSCCPRGTNVIVGTGGHDFIWGTSGRDCILGLVGGEDDLFGRDGDDYISGGEGDDDDIDGDDGNDYLTGGNGNDYLEGDGGNDTLIGGDGNDRLNANAGNDICEGGPGNDDLDGDSGNDVLRGGAGADYLEGDSGTDTLEGDQGNDKLRGGWDNDSLNGGPDVDDCDGGPGTDTEINCE
jgi:hypothetical protein